MDVRNKKEYEKRMFTRDEVEAAPILGDGFDLACEKVDAGRRLGLVAVVHREEPIVDVALTFLPNLYQQTAKSNT